MSPRPAARAETRPARRPAQARQHARDAASAPGQGRAQASAAQHGPARQGAAPKGAGHYVAGHDVAGHDGAGRDDAGRAAHARKRLSEWIAEKGLKATRQRDVIVDTFFESPGHLSVDELLEAVLERDGHVGAATVYRTMKILTECGLASARHFDDGQTRYEPALDRKHHDHLICTSCHDIVEFENEAIEELQETVARHHGFSVTRHKLELYGLCRSCQAQASGRKT